MQPATQQIDWFLTEDIGTRDWTAEIISPETRARATVLTREYMVLCGCGWFDAVFARLNAGVKIRWYYTDGDDVNAGQTLCELEGNARSLLTGERTGLNLLQTLSGTATLARIYSRAVEGIPVTILDTRKTIPGLRDAQKYAVRQGGCDNHRLGLYDGILIKENHIMAAGSIALAVAQAKALNAGVSIEVEVENIEELQEALTARPDRILLDNFDLERMKQAVALARGQVELEVSGNVTLDNIRDIAHTGVQYISVGTLTKHLKAIDLSMRIELTNG
ncbi:MAG: carboxylating nicotinate-nucleotide diphosphorylase [Methylococcaceae bacterium]